MTTVMKRKALSLLIVIVVLFGVVFSAAPNIAYAEESLNYDSMWANMLIKTIELKYNGDVTRGCVHLRRKNLSVEVVNEWGN